MMVLALALFAVLAAISALHLYWALGGLWPGHDARSLAETVIGEPKRREMPPLPLTVVVAALILGAGLLAVFSQTGLPLGLPDWVLRAGLWALALVFLARGAVTYILRAQAAAMAEPFATLNRRYYSPLCLLLGAGFLALAVAS